MIQTIPANQVTLRTLKKQFGLQLSQDEQFFPEWRQADARLSEIEAQILERVKANFLALMEDPPLLENTVKMVVLAPLLDLAGFYRQPFRIETEPSVTLEMEDEGMVIQGRIDVLVQKHRLWLLVIESKRSDFAVSCAIPQALAYMLGNGDHTSSTFGMITNGNEFLFLKATRNPAARYANSRLFSLLNPEPELGSVLQILKHLGEVAVGD
ncbi:MAG: putative type I restriction enzyme R protein [Phormidium sp. OSCR]|nr:MAG: putative type I restriction enzyme R protein [Phormidium sp. OSCR]